jgi:hypothetical protein
VVPAGVAAVLSQLEFRWGWVQVWCVACVVVTVRSLEGCVPPCTEASGGFLGFSYSSVCRAEVRWRSHTGALGQFSAGKQSEGSPLLTLPLLIWLFVCWLAARLAHDWTGGRRSAYWATFLVLFLSPWTNTFIRYGVAASYYARFGRLIPEAPIVVSGFLTEDRKYYNYSPPLQYLTPPNGNFDFVEVRFTARDHEMLSHGMPSMVSGPGFYQFRLADSSVADCSTPGVSGKPVGVYAHSAHCYTYTRSDRPMSRYALVSEPKERIWSGVNTLCMKIVDLHDQRRVARSCSVTFDVFPFGDHTVGPPGGSYREMLAVLQSQSDRSH